MSKFSSTKTKFVAHPIEVGNPILIVQKNAKWVGICHAIDSRIEGNAIINEVRALLVAGREDGEPFFSLNADAIGTVGIFEMKECSTLLVSPSVLEPDA